MNFTDTGDGCFSDSGGYTCNDLYGEDTEVLQLPFTFQFYGIEYDEITVSTNGWISFGNHEMSAFRNYSIPGAGGPSPMVAAFWDDLTTDVSGQVYYKFEADDYVIIQWDNMPIHGESTTMSNTFQMIIYNPENSFTPTGDGEIKVQYKEFNNISNGNHNASPPEHGNYSTIGIENHLGNVGLEYTFDDNYPTEAMELSDNTAIFITTTPPEQLPIPSLGYSDESLDFFLDNGEVDSQELVISNNGEPESVLNYIVSTSYPELDSPFAVTGGGPDGFGYFWSDSDIDQELNYEWIDISTDGTSITLPTNDVGTTNFDIGFSFPFYGMDYTEFLVNPNGWIGFGDDNDEWHNGDLPSSNGPTSSIMGFWDDLNPVNNACNASCSGEVLYHSNQERLVVWFNNIAHWVTEEFPESYYDFQIVIYPSGESQINYRELIGDYSATVGIQNGNASFYLQIDQYTGSYFHDELSIY